MWSGCSASRIPADDILLPVVMRVIAGSARGTRLSSVPDGVRPTADRVRESVFNSLGQFFDGGSVLDLYAGTGALGIEALSRGFDEAVFVEKDRSAAGVIRDNLAKSRLSERSEVMVAEARRAVEKLGASGKVFNLIFADPPYRIAATEVGGILPMLVPMLTSDGRIVIEADAPVEVSGVASGEMLSTVRRYGGTFVTTLKRSEGAHEQD